MPNWASGPVIVTGTFENIKGFLSHFIFDTKNIIEPYFARSFPTDTYEEALSALTTCVADDTQRPFSFQLDVEFAWSAYSCLISGYPDRSEGRCITLEDACKLHNVTAEIFTEECGIFFAEHIICSPDGFELNECVDLVTYKCRHCGETMGVSPYNDIAEYECCECGSSGEDNWEECSNECEGAEGEFHFEVNLTPQNNLGAL